MIVMDIYAHSSAKKSKVLPRKKRWTKEEKKNRKRKITSEQLVPESGTSLENITFQLNNSSNEASNTRAELQNNPFSHSNKQGTLKSPKVLFTDFSPISSQNVSLQTKKKKRKIAVKQLNLESETSFKNIASQNNFLSKNVLPKTKKKKRKRKRKKTAKQLVPESETSENIALQLNNSSNEAIDAGAELQNIPFTQSNNQDTLKSSAVLLPAFIPISSQNVVNTTKVKKETTDCLNQANSNSCVKIKTEVTRNNDCELIAIVKPVRKVNQQLIHNLNIKKDPLEPVEPSHFVPPEQLFSTLSIKDESMQPPHSDPIPPEQLLSTLSIKDESIQCETAPASPIDGATSISQSSSFTPEEIQFSLLLNLPEESTDHNFRSITEPVSFLSANEKDAPNVSETENLNEFAYELQEFSDANSKSLLSLEELSLCIKTIHSISSHLETKFASNNKLLKSFTGSIKEAVKQIASSSIHQNISLHSSPEISNDFEISNPQLENRPSEINELPTNHDSSSSYNALASVKRPYSEFQYSDSKSPPYANPLDPRIKTANNSATYSTSFSSTNPADPKDVPYSQERRVHPDTSKKKPTKRSYSELQYSDSKSPPLVNPLDHRITTKNNSATYSTSFSSTNPVDPKDVPYSRQRKVHSDTSVKKPVKRSYSELQYSDSKSPPYVNPLDPRITTKSNSETHSKSFSSASLIDPKGVPHSQQTQIGNFSPPYVNPLDPRITKNNSATYSTSFPSTNPVNPKVVPYSQQRQVRSDTSIKKTVKRPNSELKYSDSKSPPYVNRLDPRITTKSNSETHSKSFSRANPVGPKDVPYSQQTQIGNVEHLSSISLPVRKKICLEYPNLGNSESNSPKSDHLIHQNSTPIQLSSNNMTNSSSSQKINSKENNSSSFVKLLPHSLIQDIGVNFIPSSYVYLIIIGWREEWFSEYEKQSKINSFVSLPPILNKSNSLSQVLSSYQCEKEHYNTYFKLLLVECWYKLYLSWKNVKHLNKEYSGKIRECVEKKEFMKYVVEYFIPATEKDNMPDTGSILQLKFSKYNGKTFSALGYISNVMHRPFDSLYDNNNEAFKVLNVSGDNILKYKVEMFTVYKCNEIDTKQMLTHKKLMNVGNVLQQNDGLNNLSKSPLCEVILDPVTSLNKISLSIPDKSGSSSIPLNLICEQILTSEPLLVLVNSSLSSANRISVIHYITKNILSTKPRSKVIICSKSKNKLCKISNDLQKHGVVFISQDPVPVMQKYSLKKLVEKEIEKNPQLNQKDVQSKLLRNCSVITILFPGCYQCDVLKELNDTYCILDNAHKFTEPMSIIPLIYGTTKFVLFGNKTKLCDVPPITAIHGYNRSLFHRATM